MSSRHRILAVVLIAALLLVSGAGLAVAKAKSVSTACHDATYWRTHPESWPVDSVNVGYNSSNTPIRYTKAQAIEILRMPVDNDMTYVVFREDLAAKLNSIAVTNPPYLPVGQCLSADMWLQQYPLGSKVSRSSDVWSDISGVVANLSTFNHWRP